MLDERDGSLHVGKVPSTADPIEGVLAGIVGHERRPGRGRVCPRVGCDGVRALVLQRIACEPPGMYEDVMSRVYAEVRHRGADDDV